MSIDRQKIVDAAQKYAAKGQFDKAVTEYQRILREDPSDVRILLKVGDLQVRLGAVAPAVESYARVGTSYEQQGFHQKAIAVYKQILQIDPGQSALHIKLADLYVRLGLASDAMQHLGTLAQKHARSDETDALVNVLRRMVQVDAQNLPTRIRLAELLSKLSRGEEAAIEFDAACDILERMGRGEDWSRVAERLFFHHPTDVALAKRLAAYYLQSDDAKRALPKLQVAYKAEPRNVETLELLASTFRVLAQLPKTLSVLKEIAKIHNESGRHRDRDEVWKRVLELAPTDDDAREALRSAVRPVESAPAPALAHAHAHVTAPVTAASPRFVTEVDDGFEEADDVMIVEDEAEVIFDLKPTVPPAVDDDLAAPMPSSLPPASTAAARRARSSMPPTKAHSYRTAPTNLSAPRPYAPSGAAPVPVAPPVAVNQGPSAEAARLVGEAEIFLKYGLRSKVSEHLHRASKLDADNLGLQVRVRDLYVAMNDPAGMVRSAVQVARLMAESDPTGALAEMSRALEIDPTDGPARALDEQLQVTVASMVEMGPTYHEALVPEYARLSAVALDEREDLSGFGAKAYGRGQMVDAVEVVDLVKPPRPRRMTSRPAGPLEEPGVEPGRLEIEEGLDEAEFFVTQGLYEDARDTLHQLLEAYPNHPLVLERWGELEQLSEVREPADDVLPSFAFEERFDDETEALSALDPRMMMQGALSLEQSFDGMTRESVGLSAEDCDTHYDLGIAYKEMGLLDDAIAEFRIATQNVQRQCIGETMIGLCYQEKGEGPLAIDHFKRGLLSPHRTEHEELALYFEIATAYEQFSDASEALYYYQKVEKRDPSFRNVRMRVQRMQELGGGSRSGAAPGIDDLDRAFDDLVKE